MHKVSLNVYETRIKYYTLTTLTCVNEFPVCNICLLQSIVLCRADVDISVMPFWPL